MNSFFLFDMSNKNILYILSFIIFVLSCIVIKFLYKSHKNKDLKSINSFLEKELIKKLLEFCTFYSEEKNFLSSLLSMIERYFAVKDASLNIVQKSEIECVASSNISFSYTKSAEYIKKNFLEKKLGERKELLSRYDFSSCKNRNDHIYFLQVKLNSEKSMLLSFSSTSSMLSTDLYFILESLMHVLRYGFTLSGHYNK